VALVTGASRGIGRACAETLASSGAEVIAVARSAGELQNLARGSRGRITIWACDITTEEFCDRVEALPQLDVLVNSAGSNRPMPVEKVDTATLDHLLDLNVRAAFRVAQSAVRAMLRAGRGGSIIQISSQMGHVGAPQRSVYCMTKHAIEGLTRAMAVELAPRGIRVNSVAPTFVETPLTHGWLAEPRFREWVLERIPAGRLASAEEIAAAVLFLAAPAQAMVTGTSLRVDGGWTAQ
jgi:NAD(P)-dependent dehydrogenase (short-subunit alcohol dehydrogenase family)